MKRIIFTCITGLALLLSLSLNGQDAGRTAATKIGDALNQLPAQNEALFVRLIEDLLSTGEEGILLLADKMKPAGETPPPVEYALDGIVQYVTRPDTKEEIREMVARTCAAALERVPETYNKAFFIRELQFLGRSSSLETLAPYVFSAELSIPAIEAVTAIGGTDAVTILLSAPQSEQSISGLGRLGSALAEKTLAQTAQYGSPNLRSVAYNALAQCGTMASMQVMQEGPVADYLTFLRNNIQNGTDKQIAKAARKILKNANDSQTRCDALGLLLRVRGELEINTILAALDDPDRAYCRRALEETSRFVSPLVNTPIIKKMEKLNNAALADVLFWLGEQRDPALLPYIWAYLDHPDTEVARVCAGAMVLTGGEEVNQRLASQMTGADPVRITIAGQALLSCKGDVAGTLASVFSKASPQGKAMILQLLAARKARAHEALVLDHIQDSDTTVRNAALLALSGTARPENRALYFNLLENAPAEDIPAIQSAVMASLYGLGPEEQCTVLTTQLQKSALSVQQRYYGLLAQTGTYPAVELLAGIYLGMEDFTSYMALINQWNAPGEQKLLYLRKALDLAKDPKSTAALLREISATNTFLGIMVSGPYMESPHNEVALAAALSVYQLASRNKHFYGPGVSAFMEQAIPILEKAGYPDSVYDIQNIRKYLNEVNPNDGFTPLFNGKDLEGWKGLVGNPVSRSQMKPRDLEKAQKEADKMAFSQWIVEDGKLVFLGKGDNLCTKKDFGDFELYVDWLLYPEGPEADAGIYLRGTPQVQIWDTSRVNVGAQVGSGGLYNNQKNKSVPLVVADNRLGEWNSFFIRMTGERVTVYLNGQLVVDNVIMENYWDRSLPIFPSGAIELQAHGSKVAYRDLYVRELERPEPFRLSAQEEAEGFEVLFDGTTLHKWTGNTTDYITENGTIAVHPTDQGFGDLYTVKEYDDFIFRFEFKLTPGANNGVGIRTPGEGDAAYVGMEIQILDHFNEIYQPWLLDYQHHGSVYGVIPARNRNALKPVGEWNQEEIYAKGNYIRVTVNGVVVTEGDISTGPIDKREHPGLKNKSGKIGFLGHGSELWLRNIRIKEL